MQSYNTLIYEMIKGDTPLEKYNNLKAILDACQIICLPRRGTDEEKWTIYDAAEHLSKHIENPNL